MSEAKLQRRKVPADLYEDTPGAGGLGHWILASPALIFASWSWIDLFAWVTLFPSTGAWPWLVTILGGLTFILLIALPFGYLAHRIITSFPRLFQNAGWAVRPLETVRDSEIHMVIYIPQKRYREKTDWGRIWLRVAQGWVYLEILAIFVGALLMIPLFFSAVEFGFGR